MSKTQTGQSLAAFNVKKILTQLHQRSSEKCLTSGRQPVGLIIIMMKNRVTQNPRPNMVKYWLIIPRYT